MIALSSDIFRQASKYRASKYTTPPSEMKAATETGQTAAWANVTSRPLAAVDPKAN
jgi:hypothetical protein